MSAENAKTVLPIIFGSADVDVIVTGTGAGSGMIVGADDDGGVAGRSATGGSFVGCTDSSTLGEATGCAMTSFIQMKTTSADEQSS